MIVNPQHGVSLGGLALVEAGEPVVHAEGFTTEVSADGTTWGNPEVVISSLISELSDGDRVSQERTGNRSPVLYVRITASTHAGLVAGDTALGRVVGPPCELTWQPPDPLAPLSVIRVVHSKMDHQWDDMDSLRRARTWVITMAALPWIYSAEKVITPAVASASATVVNNGSSTTGWATQQGGAVSVVSGAVVSTYPGNFQGSGGNYCRLTLTASINTSIEQYVGVDWKSSVTGATPRFVKPLGFEVPVEVRRDSLTAGYVRSWYRITDASLTGFSFIINHASIAGTQTLSIDQVVKAATLSAATARQITRTVDPGGNVPAEGTIRVESTSAGLGSVLVFSHPAKGGYSPSLRQWRASGHTAPVADATTVSGFRDDLTGFASFVVPIESVPTGDVHLWGRVLRNAIGTTTLSGAAYTATAPGSYIGPSQSFSTLVNFGAAFTWAVVPLARFTLPTAQVGAGGLVQIDIIGANAFVDELWLFAMDKGRLTVIECGTGTPAAGSVANRLRISAPSVEEPFGSIMVATRADFADAYSPNVGTVLCDQTGHRFEADGDSIVHAVTSGPVVEADVSFEHTARWRAEAGT